MKPWLGAAAIAAALLGAARADAVSVQSGSPWPSMRLDERNTAHSVIRARYRRTERPWSFRTRKDTFSTPVIGAGGTVFFDSADTWFYAVSAASFAGAPRPATSSTRRPRSAATTGAGGPPRSRSAPATSASSPGGPRSRRGSGRK